MKCIVIKYYFFFLVIATFAGCTKVTQTQTPTPTVTGTGDTLVVKKVDTLVKTKPAVPDSTSLLPKALYIKVVDPSGKQAISNVTFAIVSCLPNSTSFSISSGTCSLGGSWQTDANGTIFIDSSENLGKPGLGLRFYLSKENYWTDSNSIWYVQPGLNKADTITFTLYAVSWLKVHLQDSIPADSGRLQMYFTPNGISGPIMFPPNPPPPTPPSQPWSISNFQMNSDPSVAIGYLDHLKYFSPGVDITFYIKTAGLINNQILIERYVSYYDKPTLYSGTGMANNLDTLDWEITLH